ncbi:prepilin-type N-terminal cleavage/methylation domain-containing protein [Beggiatoa alba B18LD]|uniref:Prepilin-type N-terminal cleavage/methylation domain-containing protein n=1 Tax=Beggiatoa alba B18LD TaxID=395493 RepID=I3CJB4_9GAMM|nr:type II secretion system protein [Beggiatoa alba]EIJ43707.1 prepilin-type N-terminal cleavage/methylation domain-containing protein [Beggiatoa alba B18LD]
MIKQRGFTLLEAIVALVLIATTGLALFSWINTNLFSLYRVQQVQQQHEAVRNALALISTINPLVRPEGREPLGQYQVAWTSNAIEPPRDGINRVGSIGLYQVALFEMTVQIYQAEELLTTFNCRQIGAIQVRDPATDL